MVRLTSSLLYQANRYAKDRQKWIDSLRVYCKGGHGGNGFPKMGGIGGKGGDCILEVDTKKTNLYDVFVKDFHKDPKKQRLIADAGMHGRTTRLNGEAGQDKVLKVPPGIIVSNDAGKMLYDLNEENMRLIVASGGQGGGPYNNWIGQEGSKMHIRLDLKLIADLGLVGFPNAGKSTLLKAISKAKPKIASYPFTTIKPNLGKMVYEDFREISMADLPGLIEGAHYNIGMGHKFLKHVERTNMLLFIVDIQGFQLDPQYPHRSAFETIALLNRELELYKDDLLDKPAICLINKMDTEGAKEKLNIVEKALESYSDAVQEMDEELRPNKLVEFKEVIPMSAKFSQKTVSYVKKKLRYWLDDTCEDEEAIQRFERQVPLKLDQTSDKHV